MDDVVELQFIASFGEALQIKGVVLQGKKGRGASDLREKKGGKKEEEERWRSTCCPTTATETIISGNSGEKKANRFGLDFYTTKTRIRKLILSLYFLWFSFFAITPLIRR